MDRIGHAGDPGERIVHPCILARRPGEYRASLKIKVAFSQAWARRLALVAIASVVAAVASGCSSGGSSAGPGRARLNVVASMFPLAEAARRVGGGRVSVIDMTPNGAAPRHVAIGPKQVAQIQAADVVIEVGRGFQPAVESAVGPRPITVAVLPAIGGTEPHVWLDPDLMQQVVALVAQAFQRADPLGRAEYRRGARDFDAALGALDIGYRTSLADCARHDMVTSYEAFGRLGARYGLTELGIAGQAARSEAGNDSRRLAALAELIRAKHITTVFTEPLTPLSAADVLARQTHLKTEVLDPIEGLTTVEGAAHATYLSLMTDNLEKLRSALGCTNSEG